MRGIEHFIMKKKKKKKARLIYFVKLGKPRGHVDQLKDFSLLSLPANLFSKLIPSDTTCGYSLLYLSM